MIHPNLRPVFESYLLVDGQLRNTVFTYHQTNDVYIVLVRAYGNEDNICFKMAWVENQWILWYGRPTPLSLQAAKVIDRELDPSRERFNDWGE